MILDTVRTRMIKILNVFTESLKEKFILKSNIVDDLTSTSKTAPLSANQGKVLDEKIGEMSLETTKEEKKTITVGSNYTSSVSFLADNRHHVTKRGSIGFAEIYFEITSQITPVTGWDILFNFGYPIKGVYFVEAFNLSTKNSFLRLLAGTDGTLKINDVLPTGRYCINFSFIAV